MSIGLTFGLNTDGLRLSDMKKKEMIASDRDLTIHNNFGSVVSDCTGRKYMYLPYWIEIVQPDPNSKEDMLISELDMHKIKLHKLGDLPVELQKMIRDHFGE